MDHHHRRREIIAVSSRTPQARFPLPWSPWFCVGLAIWLVRPFAAVKTTRELIAHRWVLAAVLAVGGSIAIAIAPSAAFWPIGLGFLIYSGMVPLRLANQAHWWREAVAAGAAWTIVWSALGITTSEVGPHAHDEPTLFGLLGPASSFRSCSCRHCCG